MHLELAVQTTGLTRDFGSFRAPSMASISWFPPAVLYGFLGPNGAGKSTTIKCLTGLLRADRRQRDDSRDRTALADPVSVKRPHRASCRRDLAAVRSPDGAGNAHVRRAGARDRSATAPAPCLGLLNLMELKSAGTTLVTDFSHGMRKKLSLAAALLPAPKLLFLDEPFEGIDAVASAPDQRPSAVVRLARRHHLSHVAHPGDCRAAVDPHRRDCRRQDGGAGSDADLRAGAGSGKSLEELFIGLVGGDARTPAALDWI
jgi:ABC-type branched-subunit amino acid transport system ATPase component